MDSNLLGNISSLVSHMMPEVPQKCTDPKCKHQYCSQNEETGEWYHRIMKDKATPNESDLPIMLQAAQLKELKNIKSMLSFFTWITIAAVVVVALAWVNSI